MLDRADEQRLREILDQTRFPSPDLFIWGSVVGYLIAACLLVVGYRSSIGAFLLLASLAAIVAVISTLEDRIWRTVARGCFVRKAVKAGVSAQAAGHFWDDLDEDTAET